MKNDKNEEGCLHNSQQGGFSLCLPTPPFTPGLFFGMFWRFMQNVLSVVVFM